MDKYTPEVILGVAAVFKNCVLVCACAWTIVSLYKLSGSWHCLWPLVMLAFMSYYKFTRD